MKTTNILTAIISIFCVCILLLSSMPINALNNINEQPPENKQESTEVNDKIFTSADLALPLISTPLQIETKKDDVHKQEKNSDKNKSDNEVTIIPNGVSYVEITKIENEGDFLKGSGTGNDPPGDEIRIGIIDLDVDSDNNDSIRLPARSNYEDFHEEETENGFGKNLICNLDDDNNNRKPDLIENNIVQGENDLAPMILQILPDVGTPGENGTATFHFKVDIDFFDTVRIWKHSNRGILGIDNISFNADYESEIFACNWYLGHSINSHNGAQFEGDIDGSGSSVSSYMVFWLEGIFDECSTVLNKSVTIKVVLDTFNGKNMDNKYDEVKVKSFNGNVINRESYVPKGYSTSQNSLSRAWFNNWISLYSGERPLTLPSGFPLNLALLTGFGPGDYPPVTLNAEESSVPLLSGETEDDGAFQGPTAYMERPTQNDVIDLITGAPLLQETDFELPFGGATYRSIRTYSENIVNVLGNREAMGDVCVGQWQSSLSTFWDWNGKFWMRSENPILLINASYEGLVNDTEAQNGITRCYFIPDAQHAIPFTYDTGSKQYLPPLWFDAVMTYSKAKNPLNPEIPLYFYIWLNHNTIKYTFQSYCNDVWFQKQYYGSYEGMYIDLNEPPQNGGHGVPFYGLVTEITDEYGNRIEYEYTGFKQYTPAGTIPVDDCLIYSQNANEKGQVKSIKLIPAESDIALWTILYIYRGFASSSDDRFVVTGWPDDPTVAPSEKEIYHPHQIHSMLVYNYSLDTSGYDSLVLSFWDYFSDIVSFDTYDALDEVDIFGLPVDYSYRTRYLYEESNSYWYRNATDISDPPINQHTFGSGNAPKDSPYHYFFTKEIGSGIASNGYFDGGYNLLKVNVTKKSIQNLDDDIISSKYTIYRYSHMNQDSRNIPPNDGYGLKAVFSDSTIERIVYDQEQIQGKSLNENVLFNLSDEEVTPDVDYCDGIISLENFEGTGLNLTEQIVEKIFKGVSSIETGDLDNDGDIDIVGASFETGEIVWFENTDGLGRTWKKHSITSTFSNVRDICLGLVNNDNKLDIVGASDTKGIYLWKNYIGSPPQEWYGSTIDSSFSNVQSVDVVKINQDGYVDVIGVSSTLGVAWWQGSASGSFSTRKNIDSTFTGACSIAIANINDNSDNYFDVVVASLDKGVCCWINNGGAGSNWQKKQIEYGSIRSVVTVDIDNDENIDVVGILNGNAEIVWWKGKGDGTFYQRTGEYSIDGKFEGGCPIFTADINNDGRIDVLAGAIYPDYGIKEGITWWENNGGTSVVWLEHTIDRSFDGIRDICIADIDQDGNNDILAASYRLKTVEVIDTADLFMDGTPPNFNLGKNYYQDLFDMIAAPENTTFTNSIKSVLIDRRDGMHSGSAYNFYLFKAYPTAASAYGWYTYNWYQSEYHFPYRYNLDNQWTSGEKNCAEILSPDPNLSDLDWDQPFHIMVIDEYNPDNASISYGTLQSEDILSRRIVKMNPAGFILEDETYTNLTGDPTLSKHLGYAEHYEYDDDWRVIKKCSKGWGSEENVADRDDTGLVYDYTYHPNYSEEFWFPDLDENGQPAATKVTINYKGELRTIGVQSGNGTGQPVYATQYFERNVRRRPDLINKSYEFSDAVLYTELFPQGSNGDPDPEVLQTGSVTITNYSFYWYEAFGYFFMRGMKSKSITKPAVSLTKDGASYCPVTKESYDEWGNLVWRGYGNLKKPFGPITEENTFQFFVDHYEYDDYGRKKTEIIDASPSVQFPDGFSRIDETDPLNLCTFYEYNSVYGLSHVQFPNGREQVIVYKNDDTDRSLLYQWVYNDLVRKNIDGTIYWKVFSPVNIICLKNNHVQWMKEITLTSEYYNDRTDPPSGAKEYTVLSISTPRYGPNGQISGWRREGDNDGTSLSVQISYHGSGKPERIQTSDGTITRNVYTMRGQLERIYQGTSDKHEVWRTTTPNKPEEYDDNLVLIEKRYYGNKTRNAGELIAIRHYNKKPYNQYFDTKLSPSNEDLIGWTENYSYDWRMRPVVIQRNDETGNPMNHTVTWYDDLNQVRFTAVYGNDMPTDPSVDPRQLDLESDMPTAEMILTNYPSPLSLNETIYNNRGLIQEIRTYDVFSTTQLIYLSTLKFYDQNDNVVELYEPNSPIQLFSYDAQGRKITEKYVATTGTGQTELARVDHVYDKNNRETQTIVWERLHNAIDAVLTNDNSVKTYTYKWYDFKGNTIAEVYYGTNNSDDVYISTQNPPEYTTEPPRSSESSEHGMLVTTYEYDNASNQNVTCNPDGTVTRTEYDTLNRKILVCENADDRDNDNSIRRTAYYYHPITGQLLKMAALLPAHDGLDGETGVANWSDIDWDTTDSTIQVTRFEYGGMVINGTWSMSHSALGWKPSPNNFDNTSCNNGLISRVIYPDGDSLNFTYYSDGSVASRSDSKKNTIYYAYDELGRMNTVWINDYAYYAGSSFAPSERIQQITYSYRPDGLLLSSSAFNYTSGSEQFVSHTTFVYDGFGNLKQEWQEHENHPVDSETPFIQYIWESRSADMGNVNRLKSITYPAEDDTSGRMITYKYNGGSGLDDVLSRISSITDTRYGNVATYLYTGVGRRVATSYGNDVHHEFFNDRDLGYTGLDRFGRVIELNFQKSIYLSPNPDVAKSDSSQSQIDKGRSGSGYVCIQELIQRYQYGYDLAGNRLYSNVSQATLNGQSHDNDRSFKYTYDALNRLIDAQIGKLVNTAEGMSITPVSPDSKDVQWNMDVLGNWVGNTGNTNGVTQYIDNDYNGFWDPDPYQTVDHETDTANQLVTITKTTSGSQPDTVEIVYDYAGNLVCDGVYFYQYDGFNRLLQVNQKGSLSFGTDGRASGTPGLLITTYVYDGLGCLIRKETSSTTYEDYYYDGVRRIQEQSSVGTMREYVYGPGYVDEFVAQVYTGIYGGQQITYMLQDASYNVVALLNAHGTVLKQYTYDPYGTLAIVDINQALSVPINHVGHQGLFFDNYINDGLAKNMHGLYYNRNRWYNPAQGRFMSRDPNEAGQLINTALQMNAQSFSILLGVFSWEKHYKNGMNLYQYVGSNPTNCIDSTGLSFAALFGVTWGIAFAWGFKVGMDSAQKDYGISLSYKQLFPIWLEGSALGGLAGKIGAVAGAGIDAYLKGGPINAAAGLLGGIAYLTFSASIIFSLAYAIGRLLTVYSLYGFYGLEWDGGLA